MARHHISRRILCWLIFMIRRYVYIFHMLGFVYLLGYCDSTLQWRHNGHDGASNHQPHDCLLNRLFRHRSKKTPKLRVTGLCEGNSPWPAISPNRWSVTRKMFLLDDVIVIWPKSRSYKVAVWTSRWQNVYITPTLIPIMYSAECLYYFSAWCCNDVAKIYVLCLSLFYMKLGKQKINEIDFAASYLLLSTSSG